MESLRTDSVIESVKNRVYPGNPTPQRIMTWPADPPPIDIPFIDKPLPNPRRKPVRAASPVKSPRRPGKPVRALGAKPRESVIVKPTGPHTTPEDVLKAAGALRPKPAADGLGEKVTISAVFYGGGSTEYYPLTGVDRGKSGSFRDLHMRFLLQLASTVPWSRIGSLRVATNDVSSEVIDTIKSLNAYCPVLTFGPNVNEFKYPKMRRMWHDSEHPLDTEVVISLDDDVEFAPGWFDKLEAGVKAGRKTGAVVYGDHYRFSPSRRTIKWYKSRPWWRGRELETRGGRKRAVVNFTLGGAWAMLTDYIKALNWPDPAIHHCGGDVCLGEALWQNEMKFHPVKFCNQQNMPRRGFTEPHPFL